MDTQTIEQTSLEDIAYALKQLLDLYHIDCEEGTVYITNPDAQECALVTRSTEPEDESLIVTFTDPIEFHPNAPAKDFFAYPDSTITRLALDIAQRL